MVRSPQDNMSNSKIIPNYVLENSVNLNNKKITLIGFVQSTCTIAYIAIAALILINIERIVGEDNDFLGIIGFLLLFVVSATITGTLVLGYPTILLLQHKFKEAILMITSTVGYLISFLIILGTILAFL